MAHLNHLGPEEKGPKTGRMLGKCHASEEELRKTELFDLGKGMGKKRRKGCNANTGTRSKASELFD
jgi:hypothetical protein